MSMTSAAKRMFDAYNAAGANPNKTFDGRDVPAWDGLNDDVRAKWVAAALEAQTIFTQPVLVTGFGGQKLPPNLHG